MRVSLISQVASSLSPREMCIVSCAFSTRTLHRINIRHKDILSVFMNLGIANNVYSSSLKPILYSLSLMTKVYLIDYK